MVFGKKKEKRPVGPSFPFLDNFEGGRLNFDKMVVEKTEDRLSFIFYQNEIPLYAMTYNVEATADFTYDLSDIKGSIPFEVKHY